MSEKNNEIINQVWKIELDILQKFHEVCMENGLKYTMAYGTLLGAVRHQGFIPWDDDIDIMMPREDYNKLSKIWNDVAPADYIFQDYNTDIDYTNNFAKIRKNHTTFLQSEDEKYKKYHKGIFIDIFPGDRVAPNKIGRKLQYVAFAVNLLYSRGFSSGSKGMRGYIESLLLSTQKGNYIKRRRLAEKIMSRWNDRTDMQFVFPCTIECCKHYYSAKLFSELTQLPFEDIHFYATKNYEEVLCVEYGDYMQLPPKHERIWKHHPIMVDFEHNYEENVTL